MPFKIESGYSLYRVVGPDGEEGDAVEYGTPAFLEIGHHLFMVYIDDPNEFGEHEGQLYELTTLPRGICRHRGRKLPTNGGRWGAVSQPQGGHASGS